VTAGWTISRNRLRPTLSSASLADGRTSVDRIVRLSKLFIGAEAS
jgi:hypothetical protein